MVIIFQLDKNSSKLYDRIFFLEQKPYPSHARTLVFLGILLIRCTATCEMLV